MREAFRESFRLLPAVFLPRSSCRGDADMIPTLYPSLGILPHPLYGSWPGSALFEDLSHPQQLNPLLSIQRAPLQKAERKDHTSPSKRKVPKMSASSLILRIVNRAAWLQPLPSDLHGNQAAFQVHLVPEGEGGFCLSPPSSLKAGTRHSTGDKRGGRVGGPQSSAPSSST